MIHLRIICTALAAITLSACIRTGVIHESYRPIDDTAVTVGISIRVKEFMFYDPHSANGAYFIRLEEKQDILRQDRLIYSEAERNGYIYLLNAQPGRYAVVAVSVHYDVFSDNLYLLPEALAQQTITTVVPGTIGHLGDYEVESGGGRSENSIEDHYAHLLSGENFHSIFTAHVRSSLHDVQAEKQFLRITDEEVLKKSGGVWSGWIQQRLHTQ